MIQSSLPHLLVAVENHRKSILRHLSQAPTSALLLTFSIAPILVQLGCSTQKTQSERVVQATEHIENPIRTLEARAELEMLSNLKPTNDGTIETLIESPIEILSPGSSAYEQAMVEDVLEYLSISDTTSVVVQEDLDPLRKIQAKKLYTQARAMRQKGQSDQAVDTLLKAQLADPTSTSILRELGNTLLRANDRVGAMDAFSRAYEMGDRSPQLLVHLASQAASREDDQQVIALLSSFLDDAGSSDPLIRSIAGVLLGKAEIHAGFLKAGATTLNDALNGFDINSRELVWKREIIQIINDRASLWILVGDAWTSIGADGRAQSAYAQADQDVENPPIDLIARQLGAALKRGRPAGAALIYLDHLQNNVVDLGTKEQQWAKTLSTIDGIADVLAPAIHELSKRPGLTLSIRQSLLEIEIEALDESELIQRMSDSGSDANDAMLFIKLLSRFENDQDRFNAAVQIVSANPIVSHASAAGLLRTLDNPIEFMCSQNKAINHSDTQAHEILIASLGIVMGRPDLLTHISSLDSTTLDEQSVTWLAIHSQALSLIGDWENANILLDELRSKVDLSQSTGTVANSQEARLLVSTLILAQQASEAKKLIYQLANDVNAELDDLLLAAQVAQMLEDYEGAIAFLERANSIDPANESIYEKLFTLRSSTSPTGDAEELQYIVRQLGTARPRSTLFGLLRANELARNGYIDETEELLIQLNQDHPYREVGFDLLLSIWKTQSESGNTTALVDGIAWFEELQTQDPNSVARLLSIAQGLYELETYDRSLELLQDGYRKTGSFELARAIEQLYSGPLDRVDLAQDQFESRLKGFNGIDPTIEYCRSLATIGDQPSINTMNRLLKQNLPLHSELMPLQLTQLTQIIFRLTGSVEEFNTGNELLELLMIIDEHTEFIGFELTRIKLLVLTQQPKLDWDQIVETAGPALDELADESQRVQLWALPIQSLLDQDRFKESIVLLTKLIVADGKIDDDEAIELFRLLGGRGDNADMIAVLDLLDEQSLMKEMIKIARMNLGTPDRDKPAETPDELRADLAYTAAALATAFEQNEQAGLFYQLSLSYDPNHAWSNNDYGYMLAEAGDQIELAIELLERATAAMPDEASIVDSLGWVRYKLGIFDDVLDEAGNTITEGSISLLIRANELDIEQENATILLHLGDALWRGGYPQRATEAWLKAEDVTRSQLRLLNIQVNPNRRALDAMSTELRNIRYRIQDADSTGKPQIAPIVGEQTP
ncbi:MAG: hypothetical protein P1U42_12150 [Phycisphaerales bacterium]|nr:hypothetical protein [Phycisphaerales bacterium]